MNGILESLGVDPFYLFIFKALYLKHIISKESKL